MIRPATRHVRAGCATAAALCLAGLGLTGPAASQAPSAAPAAPAAVDVRSCAKPALSPAVALKAPTGQKSERTAAAHGIAARGRELEVPARAQALAIAAHLAGDLRTGRPVKAFYDRLVGLESWQTLPPTIAVHRALGTPDPFRYESTWQQAVTLLKRVAVDVDAVESQVSTAGLAPSRCYVTQADVSALPLPPGSAFTVRKPGGETEFDAACGTPVVAATRGVVNISDSTEAGPWQITVKWDEKNITTTYAHAQNPAVTDGQAVLPGDVLAEVGDLGTVDRCTVGLSMTTKTQGKTRPLDPLTWLTDNGAAVGEPPPRIPETSFRIASYNVLGHHLTAPGGGRGGFAPGTTRVARGLARLEANGASIVVLNEFESPQAGVLLGDGDWGLHRATLNNTFRDGNGSGNAVAWRDDTWKLVATSEFTVPWQVTLHMPVVRLEHLETKAQVIVIGVHNPASTPVKGNQSGARTVARQVEMAYITQLRAAIPGVPVLFAGDMNERSEAFCGFTASGLLQSSAGGSVGGPCRMPRHGPVDWIFGTTDIDFTGQYIDRGTLGSISDHPIVYGNVYYPEHAMPGYTEQRGDPSLAD